MQSIESMRAPSGKPPRCYRCGGPAYNVTGRGDYIGHHTDLEECLRAMQFRLVELEAALTRVAQLEGSRKP